MCLDNSFINVNIPLRSKGPVFKRSSHKFFGQEITLYRTLVQRSYLEVEQMAPCILWNKALFLSAIRFVFFFKQYTR